MLDQQQNETLKVIAEYCRYDSGRHFLDSGGGYSRHHEKPPIETNEEKPIAILDVWSDEIEGGTVETAHYLASTTELATRGLCNGESENVQNQFDRFIEWCEFLKVYEDKNWFELAQIFCELLGYESQARDNIYNNENDLTQVYVWELWHDQNEYCSDWIYADVENTLFVVHIHTGCDVRGGYSPPLFLRSTLYDYSIPINWVCGYCISEGVDSDGEPLTDDQCRLLDEHWQEGYSSYPFGELRDDVKQWHINTLSDDKTSCEATLNSGERVTVCVIAPHEYDS